MAFLQKAQGTGNKTCWNHHWWKGWLLICWTGPCWEHDVKVFSFFLFLLGFQNSAIVIVLKSLFVIMGEASILSKFLSSQHIFVLYWCVSLQFTMISFLFMTAQKFIVTVIVSWQSLVWQYFSPGGQEYHPRTYFW